MLKSPRLCFQRTSWPQVRLAMATTTSARRIPFTQVRLVPPCKNLQSRFSVADFIKTFCCFYSPSIGCQLAINPSVLKFENRPRERCMMCDKHCLCATSGATPVQSWTVFCLLASLALSQTCLHWSRSGWAQEPRIQNAEYGNWRVCATIGSIDSGPYSIFSTWR